jgi:hypothetical protein
MGATVTACDRSAARAALAGFARFAERVEVRRGVFAFFAIALTIVAVYDLAR